MVAALACYGEKFFAGSGGGGSGGVDEACAGIVCDDQNPGTVDACQAGVCTSSPGPATLPDPEDCRNQVCEGSTLVVTPDDTEVPAPDENPCTSDACSLG
jgi:hypothetical protein